MESTKTDSGHVIARYLAGQLTPEQSDAFERALSERPDLHHQTEEILKFREGLARLQERGELAGLLQASAPRRWLPYAAAAAIAAVALAAVLWLNPSRPFSALLARSPSGFAEHQGQPPPIVGTYVLARMRGGGAAAIDADVQRRAGALELRILPSATYTAGRFRAVVRRVAGPDSATLAGPIEVGPTAPDGYVTVYLDSRHLAPGYYELSLAEFESDGSGGTVDRFVIHLR